MHINSADIAIVDPHADSDFDHGGNKVFATVKSWDCRGCMHQHIHHGVHDFLTLILVSPCTVLSAVTDCTVRNAAMAEYVYNANFWQKRNSTDIFRRKADHW